MNRIDLSAHTHIEDMDGVRYLVTTNHGVSVEWPYSKTEFWSDEYSGDWIRGNDTPDDWLNWDCWCIPLTDVAPVYAYIEGEPWCCPFGISILCSFGDHRYGRIDKLHRRAAAVCDVAEQFRLLHGELREARG